MDVAVAEEPQKKVFRARKTMRASDRQQLESIHRTRESSPKTGDAPNFPTLTSSPSSAPAPDAATPLVNGKHPDNEAAPQLAGSPQLQGREANSSPSPRPLGEAGSPSLVLSLSFSPSQAEVDEGPEPLNPSSPSLSPGLGDPAAALKKAEASRGPPYLAPGLSNGTNEEGQGEGVRTPSPPAGEERGDTRREAESVGGKAPSPIILLTPLEKEQIQRERESTAQVGSLKLDSEGSVSLPSRRSQNSPGSTSPAAAAPGEDGAGQERGEGTGRREGPEALSLGAQAPVGEDRRGERGQGAGRGQRRSHWERRLQCDPLRAASAGTPSATPSAVYRSSTTVRTLLDSRRAELPSQTPVAPAAGGAPQPVQIKAVAQPAAASVVNTVVTPVLSIISTAASTGPTSTSVSAPAPLGQPGGLTLKATPLPAGVTTSVASSSTPGAAPQPISIQPLLIQLPLSVAAAPPGALGLTVRLSEKPPVKALYEMDTQPTNRAADSTTRALPQAGRPSSSGAVIDLTEDDDDVQVTGVKKAPVQAQSPSSTSTSSSSQQPLGQRAPPPPAPVAPAPAATPQTQAGTTTMHVLPTSMPVRSGTQYAVSGPQLTVHHRPSQSPAQPPDGTRPVLESTPALSGAAGPSRTFRDLFRSHSSLVFPTGESSPRSPAVRSGAGVRAGPPCVRLRSAFPHSGQRVQFEFSLSIVLSWSVTEVDRSCAAVDSYHLYAYHEEPAPAPAAPPSQWKKIGEVKALPLPMACTLTQFVSGSKYYFAVRARDVYGRFGPFCDPQSTDVIAAAGSS
ncbi:MCAF1 protein, partial [Atractosteus spatula]|nr:MCAF1 protein [Atractosteus spatula]